MTPHFDETERRRFVERLWTKWGREVHLFRRPFSSLLATREDFWVVLKNWSQEVRSGKRFVHPRWIDQDLLPSDADDGLDAFFRRVEIRNDQDWYLYEPDGVQQWNPLLWHRAVELLRPILERVGGLPPGGVRFELFLGRYSRTVTGIHRDEAEGLAFVTQGPKRLYFWPRETFQDRWATADRTHFQTGIWSFEKHLDSAIVVEAEVGDVIYWPHSYYHIGASPEKWSGMVTMSIWWQASAERAIQALVDSLLSGRGSPVTYPLAFDDMAAAARTVPAALQSASEAARAALGAHWNAALAQAWARVVTAYGFLTTPAPQEVVSNGATRYFVRHPIVALEIEGRCLVFACGHRLAGLTGEARALAGRLQALPIGQTFDVQALDVAPSAASARDRLLNSLQSVGAIVPA
jgi:50S ribosomal protein L16 3-hydroxylase